MRNRLNRTELIPGFELDFETALPVLVLVPVLPVGAGAVLFVVVFFFAVAVGGVFEAGGVLAGGAAWGSAAKPVSSVSPKRKRAVFINQKERGQTSAPPALYSLDWLVY